MFGETNLCIQGRLSGSLLVVYRTGNMTGLLSSPDDRASNFSGTLSAVLFAQIFNPPEEPP
jgi:hypothetical protein